VCVGGGGAAHSRDEFSTIPKNLYKNCLPQLRLFFFSFVLHDFD
jgi:hypothetical protein